MVRQHHTTAAIAITVALTLGLAPVAAADPAPLAQAEATIAANQSQGRTAVRSNPDEQTATTAATDRGPCSEVCSDGRASYGLVSQSSSAPRYSIPALLNSAPGIRADSTAGRPPSVVRVVTHDGGFDWGDAGIGAGATVILLGIGFAGASAATSHRRRHLGEQRAVVTD
ncbi:MAG TPA: hypothetical protein VJU79_09220 [Candidatus Dormibacteraeota bacterium]|nr:hypothetical protein [Candidatus Dormibacteraeota bacterium]